jgi:hypothetical protein
MPRNPTEGGAGLTLGAALARGDVTHAVTHIFTFGSKKKR